ncbi:MAG: hypothetical protein KGL40_05510 [Rhodocyclaceae bacterium]|nr:hypothetical protein [Rhodocyclaceae bacterium]
MPTQEQEPDLNIEALSDQALNARLNITDWNSDPHFITTEQLSRLFRRAREANDQNRLGIFSRALSKRILRLAKTFALKSHIYPINFSDLDQAAEEISLYVWECLMTRPKDASFAEQFFGQLFKRRALDFQKRLMAKKRKYQVSLDAMDHSPDDEDPEKTVQEIAALRDEKKPEEILALKQEHAIVAARLQNILTSEEYSVFLMLYVEDMMVKDIAIALEVTPRTINNYKNEALKKIKQEFQK